MNSHLVKLLLFLSCAAFTHAQISVTGLADRTIHADSVTFTIENQAGYSYDARLDGDAVPVGTPVLVTNVDYHELTVFRTNDNTHEVVGGILRQFVIRSSERGHTEDGIPAHTPYPLVGSTEAEFAEGQLRLIAPQDYPEGMRIPVVAWVEDSAGHALRVNGTVAAPGQASFQLFRGVGSALLDATNAAGVLNYAPSVGGLTTNKLINIESDTVWTGVAGTLSGNIDWPDGSRIAITNHLVLAQGATLTIGPGTIVRVGPGVDITNNAQVVINGTLERPVVFAPESVDQPWGGFTMRNSAGSIVGTGVIFTGSGADPTWFGSGGNPGSHRLEQALFYCGGDNVIELTDSAAVYLAGQLGHSVDGGDFTLTRFLLQRASTGGEYTGANFIVNDSAFIEFAEEFAENSAAFTDGDNDALYIIRGTHGFTNTLFGWTTDDGVDSGGSSGGLLEFRNCWFEGIFHEGNSLSGVGKVVNHHHDVFVNCGQALEAGYDSPHGLLDDCLVIHNQTGGRFGDNYTDGRSYTGFLRATNSILLHNHRDVWGMNLNDWIYHTERMDVRSNWLTVADPHWPDNQVWNPTNEASRLAAFVNTPSSAGVGAGFLSRAAALDATALANGIPVGLSCFSTNPVTVDFQLEFPGQIVASGSLDFSPGEMIKHTPPLPALPSGVDIARVRLTAAQHCQISGQEVLWVIRFPSAPLVTLIPAGASWQYFDQGVLPGPDWTEVSFDDSGWSQGLAELGYGDGDEATTVGYGGNANDKYITTYFRRRFEVSAPESLAELAFEVKRDDGAVVHVNGGEVFRSNMPGGPVSNETPAPLAGDDGNSWWPTSVPAGVLVPGTNVVGVEIHQQSATSSDISFDLQLTAAALPRIEFARFGMDWILYWMNEDFTLESATDIAGPWISLEGGSPMVVDGADARRFFRLSSP